VRVTASSAGIVVDGASNGRGAWLCRGARPGDVVDRSCLDTALARRAFSRAWRVDNDAIDDDAIRAGFTGGDESDAQ
jgi:predicted RNA-binding protein YlxR (DUF448 family)